MTTPAIRDYDAFIAHLGRTGRMKLLPQVLRELYQNETREKRAKARHETAEQNPSLISGSRSIENGILTDNTSKSALITIYRNIIG